MRQLIYSPDCPRTPLSGASCQVSRYVEQQTSRRLSLVWLAVPLFVPLLAVAGTPTPRMLAVASYNQSRPALMTWSQSKWYVIGIIVAGLIEVFSIIYLLVNERRRRTAERERASLAALVKEEHHHLDEVVSNVPGLVWETLIDPSTGVRKPTFISSYVEKLFGYTPEEWLAEPPGFGFRLMPDPGDREKVRRDSEAVVASGKDGFTQYRSSTKDGHVIWVETYLSPMFSENGKVIGLRGVSLDVTDRKQAEETVRQAQEKTRAIVQAIPDLIFLHSPDGVCLDYHANESGDLMVEPEEFIGKSLREVLPPEIAEKFLQCFARLRDTDEPQTLEYQLSRDGVDRWFEARIVHSGQNMLSVVRDITQRRLAEAALEDSELNYRSIFNAANDAIFVHDLETGAVLDVNERMCEMYDYTVAEARQATVQDLSANEPPYTNKEAMALIRKAVSGQPQVFEWHARKKSGELFWVEVSLRHILLGGKNRILAVVRDITERKNATDQLRQIEERFAKAFRANPQPMSITTIAEGRYLDVNDSFLAMSGYTRDEVIGHTSLELHVWEKPESRNEFVQQLIKHGSTVNVETIFRTKSGATRTLLSSAESLELGGVACLLVASSDVTDRVLAQQALQESEVRFRTMADTAPVMIWVSGTDKLCNYFNQQWLDFTGRSREQELGNGWTEGIHPDDYSQCLKTYETAFDQREPFRMEYRLRRADGVYRWVFDTGTPRFSPTGKFLGYIGSCVDITDRKEAEQELQQAHEEVSRLKNQLQEENIYLQEEIKLEQNFDDIIGESDALKYVLFKIEQVAPTDSTVLITGETGTGKELVARAIHNASPRSDRPLVKVNCATLSPSLIESELFGHEKGAFTGATARKIGRFELANGATIFLDEIGELPLELQVKLLRVIQEGEFERIGSSRTIRVDVRIIAATNRKLDLEVKRGTFREDLWYRLNVFPITVPPLRQRQGDIPLLVEHFTGRFARKLGKAITSISPATIKSLCDYSWPGNVRELANIIERAVINSHGSVLRVGKVFETARAETTSSSTMTLEEMERNYIIRVLEDRGWRIEGGRGAAQLLGMNPSTLRTRMSKLGIHKPESISQSAS